jgi:hypothetical protein
VAVPLPEVLIETAVPAITFEGARSSALCAQDKAARQRTPTGTPQPRHILRFAQTVLVDDDMKVLDLSRERFRDFNRERLCGLRK